MNDFELWESILKKDKKNLKRFDLFGTSASILWNDNEDEIEIVCLNRFINQQPDKNGKYDHFGFDLKRWLWTVYTPHGAADRINPKNAVEKKEVLKKFSFRIRINKLKRKKP